MSLITCPECGRSGVSDKAPSCPGCGYPISIPPTDLKPRQKARKATRAGNGCGTIYKVADRKNKPYRAVATTGYELDPVTGRAKQKRVNIGYFHDLASARLALANYQKNPFGLDAEKLTFRDVYERWSDEHFPEVSGSTTKGYQAAFQLCGPIANKKFVDVRLDDLQYVADHSGKNAPTLRKYKALISMVFKYATVHDIISKDADKTEFVNIKRVGNPNALNREPFSSDELNKLWEIKDTDIYYSVILMLIYTGVRISELLDLKKENINLKEQWFDVTVSKTQAGVRKVPIADKVLPFFQYWYDLNRCGYLLSTPDGDRLKYRNYYDRYWTPLIEQAGMSHRPHDCRHTCISLLTEAGIDERLIKCIVGHAGKGVTEQVYTHIKPNVLLDAVNKI